MFSQCQIYVRPEWKQHEQVFFNLSNEKRTLQPRFSSYRIWILNSHRFQRKLETLMPSRTEFFHPSSKHHIRAGTTDGERQEKMLLLLPSTGISIILQPIPSSNRSYIQGSVMNALTASHGPSESAAGPRNRSLDCGERSGIKFTYFREAGIQSHRKLPIQFNSNGFNLSVVSSKQVHRTGKGPAG